MDLPVVDLTPYLGAAAGGPAASGVEELRALCATVSASLRDTGALLVMDPRCSAADNDRFLDVVERYFARSADAKRLQERPHLHYQVSRCHLFLFLSACRIGPAGLMDRRCGRVGTVWSSLIRTALNTELTVLRLIALRLDLDQSRDRTTL